MCLMTIHIVSDTFGAKFDSLLENCKNELLIVVPFIGRSTASELAQYLEQSDGVNCTIITRCYREDFVNGSSNIHGLEQLLHAGAKIYALMHLHTKLYIFDTNSVITGSFNFTFNGFYKNHEFGILMEEEPAFTKECIDYFYGLLIRIKEAGEYLFTQARIDIEKAAVKKALPHRRGKASSIKQYNLERWGADIQDLSRSSDSPEIWSQFDVNKQNDFIENSLDKLSAAEMRRKNTGIWIKFEGSGDRRIDNTLDYMDRKVGLYEHKNRTFFPQRPKSIKKGEIVFIVVVSHDNNRGTPIIIGYAEAGGYNEGNEIGPEDLFYQDTNGQYKYFIELYNAKYLSGPVLNGISMVHLCDVLRSDLYPTYKEDPAKILSTHHQKSHLQITKKARNHILKELHNLFETYGYYSCD